MLRGQLRGAADVRRPCLVIAGATGVLGNEVLRRLVGGGTFGGTHVLAREPVTEGLRGVSLTVVGDMPPAAWPTLAADTGVLLFEPARTFHGRERALWTPTPDDWVEVARWMRRCGVGTLAVALPHDAGRLPEALKRGLASLDELAVAALGFERVLLVRSARKPGTARAAHLPGRLADFMLATFKYMVPGSEQPVRAVKVAEFLAAALQLAPPGIHVAAPELVWRAAQGPVREAVQAWLRGA